jgi:hypothetical protein
MADAELGKVAVRAEDLQKPKNHDDHYDAVQDSLDCALHRYKPVNEPKQYANYSYCDNNGDEWHLMPSNRAAEADGIAQGFSICSASFGVVVPAMTSLGLGPVGLYST